MFSSSRLNHSSFIIKIDKKNLLIIIAIIIIIIFYYIFYYLYYDRSSSSATAYLLSLYSGARSLVYSITQHIVLQCAITPPLSSAVKKLNVQREIKSPGSVFTFWTTISYSKAYQITNRMTLEAFFYDDNIVY